MNEVSRKVFSVVAGGQNLTSELDGGKLTIMLKHVDISTETVTQFRLELKDDEFLPEELKFVFGDVAGLQKHCFEKQQNYKVESNGRITIFYTIRLESEEFPKETHLQLEKTETEEEEKSKALAHRCTNSEVR